jgi:RimJ/RimL family protein N-acetyltransferase
LNPQQDDFTEYLSWMQDYDSNPFISGVRENLTLAELCDYVLEKNTSPHAILFGIFTKSDLQHVGNVKLEPITKNDTATLGILVGDESYRGKGVGFEVLSAVLDFAFNDLTLRKVELGVDNKNEIALKLYFKLGFLESRNKIDLGRQIIMEIHSNDWLKTKLTEKI